MIKIKINFLTKIFIVMFFTLLFINYNKINAESDLSKYNKELEEVREKEKENSEKLSGIEREISEYNYQIAELDVKMMETTLELADLQDKETKLNETLEKNKEALTDSSKLYESAEKLYTSRLRLVYENGIPNVFDFLLSSKDISDFFNRINVYESLLDYNKNLVTNIKSRKNYIEYVKKDIEKQKLELGQLTADAQKTTQELNKILEDKQKRVKELENSQSNLKADSEELVKRKEDAIKKIDDEIEKAYKAAMRASENGTSTEFTGGNFVWPVPGYNIITTTFGFVYYLVNPNGSPHTGCDIAGTNIFGKPIVAIESGTVIVAGYNAGGYGNYVMIDHGKCTDDGNNYISLYGHASALAVTKGDKVTKGQTIAYVGSTGNSTGPHLHLEIRINGKITDPLVQYPGLTFDIR